MINLRYVIPIDQPQIVENDPISRFSMSKAQVKGRRGLGADAAFI